MIAFMQPGCVLIAGSIVKANVRKENMSYSSFYSFHVHSSRTSYRIKDFHNCLTVETLHGKNRKKRKENPLINCFKRMDFIAGSVLAYCLLFC